MRAHVCSAPRAPSFLRQGTWPPARRRVLQERRRNQFKKNEHRRRKWTKVDRKWIRVFPCFSQAMYPQVFVSWRQHFVSQFFLRFPSPQRVSLVPFVSFVMKVTTCRQISDAPDHFRSSSYCWNFSSNLYLYINSSSSFFSLYLYIMHEYFL
jgi:hypothetical protein